MKRYLPLLLCVALAGCIRGFFQRPSVVVGDDRSIVFPRFFEKEPVAVSGSGQVYEVDGAMLKAMAIAANDFLPSDRDDIPCADRQEAHSYRVLRQGDIFFIRIDENPRFCGRTHGALDSGARYAISVDGRILRRVIDGMGEYTEPSEMGLPTPGEPGTSPSFDPAHLPSQPFMTDHAEDGGTKEVPAPSPSNDGPSNGGAPSGHPSPPPRG